jgi:eukaryotic-like serine/threonine-protein kinase
MAIMRCPSCHREYEQGFLRCPFDGAALVDAASADQTDPFLGRQLAGTYQLIRRLGAGGMGTVYEARHIRLETRVAIKFLRPELAFSEEMLARFHREARAASQLRHPHIVEVVDINRTEDNLHYIVQEYLEGEPLSAVLERQGTLELARGAYLLAQVCDALAAAHGKGIVHRDIKPENLFVIRPDGRELIKVLDFGIAKVQEPRTQLTQAYQVMGTPDYISPEQAASAGEVDFRSDIYSLGVVAYRIFTGRLPYEVENAALALDAVRVKDPTPPRARRPDLPPTVEALIVRAMQRDPAARFATMLDMKHALLALSGAEELHSVAVAATIRHTPVPPTVVPAEAHTGPPAPAAPFGAPRLPSPDWRPFQPDSLRKTGERMTPVGSGQLQRTTESRNRDERPPRWPLIVGAVVVVAVAAGVGVFLLKRPHGGDSGGSGSGTGSAIATGSGSGTGAAVRAPDARAAARDSAVAATGPAGMVLVKGGPFQMGRDDGEKLEAPAHPCEVADFYLDVAEVTAGAFAAFLRSEAGAPFREQSTWKGFAPEGEAATLPVVRVNWEEAAAYCKAEPGRRLPTEAEWEYAARGPQHEALYPSGDKPPGPEAANFSRGETKASLRPASAVAVAGLKDMIGNVSEWVDGTFGGYISASCKAWRKPLPRWKGAHVLRGGGFDDSDQNRLTATFRIPQNPKTFRWKSLGFRCARNAR